MKKILLFTTCGFGSIDNKLAFRWHFIALSKEHSPINCCLMAQINPNVSKSYFQKEHLLFVMNVQKAPICHWQWHLEECGFPILTPCSSIRVAPGHPKSEVDDQGCCQACQSIHFRLKVWGGLLTLLVIHVMTHAFSPETMIWLLICVILPQSLFAVSFSSLTTITSSVRKSSDLFVSWNSSDAHLMEYFWNGWNLLLFTSNFLFLMYTLIWYLECFNRIYYVAVVLSIFNMEDILLRILNRIRSTYSGTGGGDRDIIVGIGIRQKSQRKTTHQTAKKNLYWDDRTAFSVPSSVKHYIYLYLSICIFYRFLHRSTEFDPNLHIQVFWLSVESPRKWQKL